MEPWFIFALLSAVFSGLYAFTTKASAHFEHHPAQVTFYSMLSATILSGLYALTTVREVHQLGMILAFVLLNTTAYTVMSLSRVEALKNIDATIYFPTFKVISTCALLPIGIFLFNDTFSTTQLYGVALGILIPLLLISKKETARQHNLRQGITLIAVGIIATIFVNIATKSIAHFELNNEIYIFAVFSLISIFTFFLYKHSKTRAHKKTHVKWIGLLGGALVYGNLFCYVQALSGNLTSVFIINSFSVIITVTLAVIFFKEHFNLKKGLALIGTVAATILLK